MSFTISDRAMKGLPRLTVIIGSTRPGRVGAVIGQWFAGRARRYGGFDVEVADLAAVNLPMLGTIQGVLHSVIRNFLARSVRRL